MSDWNDEQARYKAAKNGQTDLRPATGGGKRKPRRWKVMMKNVFREDVEPWVIHRGTDRAACEAWIAKQARSYYIPRQNQSERAHKSAQEEQAERAARYWIVPPEDEK